MQWKTDPTFYPSPKLAMQAPAEKLAYVAALNADGGNRPDALVVVDVDRKSDKYGQIVGRVDMPNVGDELHHFGWNACSSALCPYAPHPHVERRYLIVPGLRSSRIRGWMVKLDVAQDGGIQLDPKLFVEFGDLRPHQVKLQGGDASSDFYCYP
jgi:methanethiol oxidase